MKFVILHKNRIFNNVYFNNEEEAYNYICMRNPRKTFTKWYGQNVFIANKSGSKFEIVGIVIYSKVEEFLSQI